jgi:hypothetical protein
MTNTIVPVGVKLELDDGVTVDENVIGTPYTLAPPVITGVDVLVA